MEFLSSDKLQCYFVVCGAIIANMRHLQIDEQKHSPICPGIPWSLNTIMDIPFESFLGVCMGVSHGVLAPITIPSIICHRLHKYLGYGKK